MANAYIDALKSKKLVDVKMASSKRRQAMIKQQGKCARCKKSLNPAYSKFIKKADGTYEVICSNCAVSIPKR